MPAHQHVTGIIKKRQVRPGPKRLLGVPIVDDSPAQEPQARIIQQGDRAVAVEVACTCGRKIYIELDYAPGDAPAACPAPSAAGPNHRPQNKPQARQENLS